MSGIRWSQRYSADLSLNEEGYGSFPYVLKFIVKNTSYGRVFFSSQTTWQWWNVKKKKALELGSIVQQIWEDSSSKTPENKSNSTGWEEDKRSQWKSGNRILKVRSKI